MKQKLKSYFLYVELRTQTIELDRVDAESKKAARKIGRAICRQMKKRYWMDKIKAVKAND